MSRLLQALALAASIMLLASACGGEASAHATIAIRYSHFGPESVTAHAGAPIAITLRNDDPIAHEWIVGTDGVHARHRTGTDPFHARIPTEVTIPPFTTLVTTVMFEQPGEYKYICHLPGHEEYGMAGTLRVEAQ